MLSSIHPLGERARNNRWSLTATAFAVGAIGSASTAGGVLGWVGSYLGHGGWRWWTAMAIVAVAGVADLARVRPPGPRRQVNEDWIGRYRGWVYGIGFGAQLGIGGATLVVTWGVWATAVVAALSGSVVTGIVVGMAFGIGRTVPPLAAGWIDRPSRLTAFNRRMAAWAPPVARTVAVSLVMVGAVGMVMA
jgi:cytochrome c biogenesis protein CcdA